MSLKSHLPEFQTSALAPPLYSPFDQQYSKMKTYFQMCLRHPYSIGLRYHQIHNDDPFYNRFSLSLLFCGKNRNNVKNNKKKIKTREVGVGETQYTLLLSTTENGGCFGLKSLIFEITNTGIFASIELSEKRFVDFWRKVLKIYPGYHEHGDKMINERINWKVCIVTSLI